MNSAQLLSLVLVLTIFSGAIAKEALLNPGVGVISNVEWHLYWPTYWTMTATCEQINPCTPWVLVNGNTPHPIVIMNDGWSSATTTLEQGYSYNATIYKGAHLYFQLCIWTSQTSTEAVDFLKVEMISAATGYVCSTVATFSNLDAYGPNDYYTPLIIYGPYNVYQNVHVGCYGETSFILKFTSTISSAGGYTLFTLAEVSISLREADVASSDDVISSEDY